MKNIAIAGRGSIGLLIALQIHKKYPNINVSLYGEQDPYSASYAAGAMINILSEIDCFNIENPLTNWKLNNRSTAIKEWDELDNYLTKKQIVNKSIYTSFGTRMSLMDSTINEVEKKSFNSIIEAAKKYNIDIELEDSKDKKNIYIKDENSVDSRNLFESIDNYLQKEIRVVNSNVKSLKKLNNNWLLKDANGNEDIFDSVIIACGSWSEQLISQSEGITLPNIQSFYGIGSALLVKSQLPHVKNPKLHEISRTPNRGGTCGIHGVQRNSSIYVGASSHTSHLPLKYPNPESIRTLFEGTERFLGIDTYDLGFETVMGYRPVTTDHVPIIGPLSDNLWCIYGTKRDGLSWAPYFSKYLVNYIFKDIDKNWQDLLDLCQPYRTPVSAGNIDECIESYLLSKQWEDFQHGRLFDEQKKERLRTIANEAHAFINRNTDKGIGLNNEIINVVYYRNCKSAISKA
jgi:glycine/D-amino acid oxidase-like deaminating enzyme